jgi:hypothetical protein
VCLRAGAAKRISNLKEEIHESKPIRHASQITDPRYGSYGNYSFAFSVAVKQMVKDRTLLLEDAVSVLNAGLQKASVVLPLLPSAPTN